MDTVIYQLAVEDLVDARGYLYNTLPTVRLIRLLPAAIAVGCALLAAYLMSRGDRDDADFAIKGVYFGLILLAWMLVGNRLLLPISVRRQLERNKGLRGDTVASWDAKGIAFRSLHGDSRWPWGDFYRWHESPKCLVLWQGDRTYLCLPKRVLTDGQLSGIRGFLRGAVGKPGASRREHRAG
jgi:hypothetical protein